MMSAWSLSNESLLELSLFLFLTFAFTEIIGALQSGSLTLAADAGCMSVDVMTYVCNAYVEWIKTHYGRLNTATRWRVDVLIPAMSTLTLLAVTVYITMDAIRLLLSPSQDDMDISYLYGYSIANFLVDMVCFGLFLLRREDVFHEPQTIPQLSLDTMIYDDDEREFGYLDDPEPGLIPDTGPVVPVPGKKNLNMMSAFMHVLGDTLRTIAMLLAAVVSTTTGIDGDVCDAWAAILVSLSIVGICWPLIVEIRKAAKEIHEDEHDGEEVELRTLKVTARTNGAKGSGMMMAGSSSGSSGSNGIARSSQAYMRVNDVEEESVDL